MNPLAAAGLQFTGTQSAHFRPPHPASLAAFRQPLSDVVGESYMESSCGEAAGLQLIIVAGVQGVGSGPEQQAGVEPACT